MKSTKTLVDFIRFCGEHPELRFWQALSVWSKGRIYHSKYNKEVDDDIAADTFYWNGKNK